MYFSNRLPFEWALKINSIQKTITKDDHMFITVEPKEVTNLLDGIDTSENIIINTPENHLCLRRNINGSMSIITPEDIGLSGKKILTNNLVVLEFRPKLKIVAPKGIDIEFCCPIDSIYTNKIYPQLNIRHSHGSKEEVSVSTIPDYLSYQDFIFTIYIDLDQLKKVNPVINIKAGTSIVDLKFRPIYHIGSHAFPNIDKVYWVKSTEIFQTFSGIY